MLSNIVLPQRIQGIRDPEARRIIRDLIDALDDFLHRTKLEMNQTITHVNEIELSAGDGIDITDQVVSAKSGDTNTITVDSDGIKGAYTAGSNVTITDGQISATNTTYTAGNGLQLTGTEFSAKSGDADTITVDADGIKGAYTAGNNITITDGVIATNAITEVADDTSPELGGNLDVGSYRIISSDGDIYVTPDNLETYIRASSTSSLIDIQPGGAGSVTIGSSNRDDTVTIYGTIILSGGTITLSANVEHNGQLGFFGASATNQPGAISDPSGGTTVDTEARAAISDILDALRDLGLIAT